MNSTEITVIQFSIDKNRIEFPRAEVLGRASVELSFHDQFAFLFVLTAVKYLVKYIGYDHFSLYLHNEICSAP